MEMKIYMLMYSYRWGYEDYGEEVLGCFKDLYHAELAAYWLNDSRASYNIPHEGFDVEEMQVV